MTEKTLRLTIRNRIDAAIACAMCVKNSAAFAIEPLPHNKFWLTLKHEHQYLMNCIIGVVSSNHGDMMIFTVDKPILFNRIKSC